jgi:hypothetical protein
MSRLHRMVKESLIQEGTSQYVFGTWSGPKPAPAKMVKDYIETALWSDEPDEDGGWGRAKPHSSVKREAQKDIEMFIKKAHRELQFAQANTILSDHKFWGQVAHDFWLTRNGHGAGFWDDPKYWGGQKNADALSKAAEAMGGKDLYVGDDGKIYIS